VQTADGILDRQREELVIEEAGEAELATEAKERKLV